MAAIRDISIYTGDTYVHEVIINDSANTAIDISGRTYVAQIKQSYRSEDIVLTFSTTITDAANGKMQMSLTKTQTATLKSGKYVYDLEEQNGATTLTLLRGDVHVTGGVS